VATKKNGSRGDEDKEDTEEDDEGESGSDGTRRRSQSQPKRRGRKKSPGSKYRDDHVAKLDERACAKEYIDELLVDDRLPMPVKPRLDWLPDASLYGKVSDRLLKELQCCFLKINHLHFVLFMSEDCYVQ
jgi:hypothetical protein